ncbi:MAG: FtsW/RodA/SpoVE family cell cycle protein [Actinobacteria bacterium]|nr:MAG: FtsW/RodA/SpoVE family cell cycle protein [Actinomycetota bacterium]TML83037.1 MAG: FtsW/RodA/SpoVE family cell cycle protein [Actinomycetota bacterium]
MKARNRELFGLLPVSLLVTAGFTAVLITRSRDINKVTVTYGLVFLGACLFAHIFIRARLPDADPYMFPLVALLAAFGLVEIYRISPHRALGQAVWFGVGLGLFCATIVFLRDHRRLERYRYTIAVVGIALLLAPRVPGIGRVTNGAYLSIGIGPIQFQPAEVSKIAIIIFLASYLNEVRDVLVQGRLPRLSLKHLGPLLVIWGAAMLMLIFIRDLGSAIMFYGAFLAVLYVATNRLSLVLPGLALFVGGSAFLANHITHVHDRVEAWLHPFRPDLVDGKAYQIAQSVFAQADGGLFGQGFGQSLLEVTKGHPIIPAAHTDVIYAVIVDELGLFGGTAILVIALLFVARGFKAATMATEGFSTLLAAGLTAVFALQVFVIVGGVTRVIPLTGVTLPFVSYGGSSIVANFILVALLLVISDRARRDPGRVRGGLV